MTFAKTMPTITFESTLKVAYCLLKRYFLLLIFWVLQYEALGGTALNYTLRDRQATPPHYIEDSVATRPTAPQATLNKTDENVLRDGPLYF